MPPRAAASPKKKRSKRKASDASKAALPKRPRAANVTDTIPSTPLISLGLTEADAMGAPRRSGHPNAGTGGRNAQLEKIGLVLESQSSSQKPKGTTSLDALNPVNPQAPEQPRKWKNHSKESFKGTATIFVNDCIDCMFRCPLHHIILIHQASMLVP